MTDAAGRRHVFLSYASEDRLLAAKIARAIESHGFTVWWDVDIPAGVHYPKFIEDGLKSAACIVVLWSRNSITSRWVRNEADWGAEHDRLVPVLVDDSEIPWEFRNLQTLDLTDWIGDKDDGAFPRLIQGLSRLAPTTGHAPEKSRISDARPPRAAPTVEPASRRSARVRLSPARTALLIVAAVLVAVVILRVLRPASKARVPSAELSYTPLTGDGRTRSSGISPDGKYLVYVPMSGGRSSLQVKQIDTGSESVLVREELQGIRSPVFSPDGGSIYFAMTGPAFSMNADAEYDLFRVSMLGGAPQRVAAGIIGRRFDCSPDGTRLVYKRITADSTVIQIGGVDGSAERTIASEPRSLSTPCCLTWSDADDQIITTTRDSATGSVSIVTVPSTGGAARPVGNRLWQAVQDLHTLADGSGLLVVGTPASDEKALNVDVWFLPRGRADFQRVTNDMTNYYQVSADATGRKLALTFSTQRRNLRVLAVKSGGDYRDVSTDVVANGHVVWAAPGRLFANQRVGNRIGIVSIDLNSGATSRIATDVDYVSDLDVSPNGGRLAYTAFRGSDLSIWMANGDGSSPRRLTEDEGDEHSPQFSPDGSWIASMYRAGADKPWVLRRRSVESGATRQLSDLDARPPLRISPDGTLIVASLLSPERKQYALAVVPSDGGEPRFLDVRGASGVLDWNPAGTGLTCFSRAGAALRVYDVPLSGNEPRPLAEIPAGPESITDADWSVAGDSLALCLEMRTYDVMLLQRPGGGGSGSRP